MSDTYIVVAGYDVGCDDCGEYDNVESYRLAEKWVENHVCEEKS